MIRYSVRGHLEDVMNTKKILLVSLLACLASFSHAASAVDSKDTTSELTTRLLIAEQQLKAQDSQLTVLDKESGAIRIRLESKASQKEWHTTDKQQAVLGNKIQDMHTTLTGYSDRISTISGSVDRFGLLLTIWGGVITLLLTLGGLLASIATFNKAKQIAVKEAKEGIKAAQIDIDQANQQAQAKIQALFNSAQNATKELESYIEQGNVETRTLLEKAELCVTELESHKTQSTEAMDKAMGEIKSKQRETGAIFESIQESHFEINKKLTGQSSETIDLPTKEIFNTLLKQSISAFEQKEYERSISLLSACLDQPNINDLQKANILYNTSVAYSKSGNTQLELETYNNLIKQLQHSEDKSALRYVAMAMINKGITIGEQGGVGNENAIDIYDQVIQRFEGFQETILLEQVAKAMLNKGVLLKEAGKESRAILSYDTIIQTFESSQETELLQSVAMAMRNKGLAFAQQGKTEEAISSYSQLIQRFKNSQQITLAEQAAMAMLNRGMELKRTKEAVASYDMLIQHFGDSQETTLLEAVSMAMRNKGVALTEQGKIGEAIATYERLIQRFSSSQEIVLEKQVIVAMLNKGVALEEQGEIEKSISAYDELIQRFKNSQDITLEKYVAMTILNKGLAHKKQGKKEEACAAYNQLIQSFGDSKKIVLQEQVARAQANLISVLPKNDPELPNKCREAIERLHLLEAKAPGTHAYDLACMFSMLNEKDHCQHWLSVCIEKGTLSDREHLENDSDLDNVRNEPWFEEILAAAK